MALIKKTKNLLEIKDKWNTKHRPFNAQLVEKRLQELAVAGKYYESKILK